MFIKAYYSFKICAFSRSEKGFKIDDFTDLLGEDFMDNLQVSSYRQTREYIEQLKANGEDY